MIFVNLLKTDMQRAYLSLLHNKSNRVVAVSKLFYEHIIKDEKDKTEWEKNLTWVHDSIDDIRYKNEKND